VRGRPLWGGGRPPPPPPPTSQAHMEAHSHRTARVVVVPLVALERLHRAAGGRSTPLRLDDGTCVVADPRDAAPDRVGSAALVRLENKHVALQSANAYISTLGGGHFLCRHVPSAVALAQAQIRVALELGDTCLAARCHVHLAYCAVLVGRFRTAATMLRVLDRAAVVLDDSVLAGMVVAARRHNRLTHKLWRDGALRFAEPHRERIVGGAGDAEADAAAREGEATRRLTDALLRVASPHGRPSDIDRQDELFRLHLVPLTPTSPAPSRSGR
jgi:hypothetical protein